jgi:hypothetical protein
MMRVALAGNGWARLRFPPTMPSMLRPRQPPVCSARPPRAARAAASLAAARSPSRDAAAAQKIGAALALALSLGGAAAAQAGTVTGRVELPAPEKREASETRGYLDAADNAILPVQAFNPTPYLLVVLEAQQPIDVAAPPQASYELRGESFARPVLAVVKGQEVVIKNSGLGPRSLVAKEDPDLIPKGTLNVTGSKSFRVAEAGKVYTIVDPSVPHLRGCIVSVSSPYHVVPDRDGRFSFDDVPAGTYKARVFFRDRWLAVESTVNVPTGPRSKAEVRLPIPAGYRAAK